VAHLEIIDYWSRNKLTLFDWYKYMCL